MATREERLPKPATGQQDYRVGRGLGVRVFASGTRVWFTRGRVKRQDGDGERRLIVLGDVGRMSREDAEHAAGEARRAMRNGIDPKAERDAKLRTAEAAQKTFRDVAREWVAASKAEWRPSTLRAREGLFPERNNEQHRLAAILDQRIGDITTADLRKLAKGINANSQQAAIGPVRTVLHYAVERGYIPKSPFVGGKHGVKIAKAEGNAEPLGIFAEGKAPDLSELAAVLEAFDAEEELRPISPWWNIWRICILTGQRPSAVIGLRWSELSLEDDAPTWTLPAERSKIHRESTIPLSQDCAEILRGIRRGESDRVWPGRDDGDLAYPPVEPARVSARLAERGYKIGWKPGRARDTVATWLEFQGDATERAMALLLGHKPPAENTRRKHYSKIAAADQARKLVEHWAQTVREARGGRSRRVLSMRRVS